MGLDAWAYAVPENILATDQEVDILLSEEGVKNGQLKKKEEKKEIWYWRKNHTLQSWMQDLYEYKGGKDPEFNCNSVRLNLEDLDNLEKDILSDRMDSNYKQVHDCGDKDDDLLFTIEARKFINNGYAIFYDSWW